jgi:hypothetical protein
MSNLGPRFDFYIPLYRKADSLFAELNDEPSEKVVKDLRAESLKLPTTGLAPHEQEKLTDDAINDALHNAARRRTTRLAASVRDKYKPG